MPSQQSDTVKTFFLLLRSGLYDSPVPEAELPGSIDWSAVARLARKHVVAGPVIEAVRLLPDRLRPSAEVLAKMDKSVVGLIRMSMIMDRTAARLAGFFRQHGVDGVLLKGPGVARYYRTPQMRQSGDIDFYVGGKLYKKALALCMEKLVEDKNTCSETAQHFDFIMQGVTVELHRRASRMYSPINNRRFQKWSTSELECSPRRRTIIVNDVEVTLPSYDFDAVYIFYHAWCHYIGGGIGLRQLCDWAMIFYSHIDDIDVKKLEETVVSLGLTKGWKLFASIVVRHLGVPSHMIPLYDPAYDKKSEKVLADILAGGNFGYYSEAYEKALKRKSFLGRGLGKFNVATRKLVSLFPIIPVEATLLYFNHLVSGTIRYSKRSMRKPVG